MKKLKLYFYSFLISFGIISFFILILLFYSKIKMKTLGYYCQRSIEEVESIQKLTKDKRYEEAKKELEKNIRFWEIQINEK